MSGGAIFGTLVVPTAINANKPPIANYTTIINEHHREKYLSRMNNPRTRKATLILTLTIATLASTICLGTIWENIQRVAVYTERLGE